VGNKDLSHSSTYTHVDSVTFDHNERGEVEKRKGIEKWGQAGAYSHLACMCAKKNMYMHERTQRQVSCWQVEG